MVDLQAQHMLGVFKKIKLKVLLILPKGQNRRHTVHLTNAHAIHPNTLTKVAARLVKTVKKI